MASFNRVILMGNLTRDPQVRYTPGGTAVTDIGLAINRTWFDKTTQQKREDVTFVDVTLWGRQAELAGEYPSKGRSVLIEGRLQLDQWDDKETGQKRSKLVVVCENMTMVGGRSSESPQGPSGSPQGGDANPETQFSEPNPAESFQESPQAAAPSDEVPF